MCINYQKITAYMAQTWEHWSRETGRLSTSQWLQNISPTSAVSWHLSVIELQSFTKGSKSSSWRLEHRIVVNGWEIFTAYNMHTYITYTYIYIYAVYANMKILMNLGKLANLSSGYIWMNVYKQFSPRINHSDIQNMFDMDSTWEIPNLTYLLRVRSGLVSRWDSPIKMQLWILKC